MSSHYEKQESEPKTKQDPTLSKGDVYTYLCLRLGLSKPAARQYLNALAEYFAITLGHGLAIELPNIGSLKLKYKSFYKIAFAMHPRLRRLVNTVRPAYTTYLKNNGIDQISNHVKDTLQKYALRKKPIQADRSLLDHPIQRSFLKYLQNDLIWDQDWEHPLTNQVIAAEQVRAALSKYRQLNILSYQLLFLVWLGTGHRQIKLKYYQINEQELYVEWTRAVNNILLLLLFPELDPKLLEGFTTEENDVLSRSRKFSTAESSERHGVYRASRNPHYQPGGLEKYFAP